MTHFLAFVDYDGVITEVKWCNPVQLLTQHSHSLNELFSPEELPKLRQLLRPEIVFESTNWCGASLRLKNSESCLKLCLLPLGDDRVTVFAIEDSGFSNQECQDEVAQVIRKFMETLKSYVNSNIRFRDESVRRQFEQIQGLNNELINTKRMLEKANSKLNVVNKDLNNRLVKDELTGLVSRYQYRSEMEIMLSEKPGKQGVFVFIDIDDFKNINDQFGHGTGDQYLKTFADRLQKMPLGQAVRMRIAGDEFGLFIHGWEQVDQEILNSLWESIRKYVLSYPVKIDGMSHPLSISAGMSVYGRDTDEIFQLIEYADFAMYKAKKKGKNSYSVFDQELYQQEKSDQFSQERGK